MPSHDTESRVNSEYSVTIPPEIRERVGLEPGDRLRWRVDEEGQLVAEIVEERYGMLDEMEPIDMGETDALEETEKQAYEYD